MCLGNENVLVDVACWARQEFLTRAVTASMGV